MMYSGRRRFAAEGSLEGISPAMSEPKILAGVDSLIGDENGAVFEPEFRRLRRAIHRIDDGGLALSAGEQLLSSFLRLLLSPSAVMERFHVGSVFHVDRGRPVAHTGRPRT